jgi:cytochrome c oxidase subunit II
MVPGMITTFWFKTTRTGSFDALCEQLCGLAHFAMRGRVVVEEQDAYDQWLAKQPTFAQTQANLSGDAAAGQALYATCSACHGDQAQGNRDLNAPKLAGQAPWYLMRQLHYFKDGVRGGEDMYAQQMAPFAQTLPDETAIRNVAAYIASLPQSRPAATVHGNPDRGRAIYNRNCVSCHGASGQGIWATNAPTLANMSDWYLKRQLEHFRDGTRGAHRQDFYGSQMSSMVRSLIAKDAVDDVVDYLRNF